jgi:hypothetical protein
MAAEYSRQNFLRPGAFVSLAWAASGTRDNHETGLSDFAAEFDALLVLYPRWLRSRRTENRDLPTPGIRREQFESVAQFSNSRLDYPNIARIFNIGEKLKRALDDISYIILVETSTFVINEVLNPPLQFGIYRRLFRFDHDA